MTDELPCARPGGQDYVLYPHRASSAKNGYRWTFGVLAPRTWSEAGGCEPWWTETQCLLETGRTTRLDGCLRPLQMQHRCVETGGGECDAVCRSTDSLQVHGEPKLPCEESRVREIPLRLELVRPWQEVGTPFEVPAGHEVELVRTATGAVAGRVTYTRWALHGVAWIGVEPVGAGRCSLLRLRIRIENRTPWERPGARRSDAVRASFLSTHLMLSASGGRFVSLLDRSWRGASPDSGFRLASKRATSGVAVSTSHSSSSSRSSSS